MDQELNTELWMEYWNLYDWNCWNEYITRPDIKKEYKKSNYNLRSYLHDHILVPAIEQIENNLEKIDGYSKFLYWFRFREEFLIITKPYKLNSKIDIDKQTRAEYKRYISHIDGFHKDSKVKVKPEYDYIKWFYIAICSLKSEAEIYFNEILFNLPIFDKAEVNKRNLELLEKDRKEKIINIYNYGNIDTIINNLEKTNKPLTKLNNKKIVEIVIENFKKQIENNGLSKLLYEGKEKKLRHENSAQQLFFSVAQIFCLANDLDVSPETNSGSGSVDFKFSKGAINKINVEIKYSNHKRLKHGLEIQLREYDKAEQTVDSFYLILQVNDNTKVIEDVKAIDSKLNPSSLKVKVVDARLIQSASIRKV
ncbi:MAG: hypothetical protein ABI237_18060 [Ginsengibacter sp.]